MKCCTNCGSPLKEGMAFCGDCGTPVAKDVVSDELGAFGSNPIDETQIGSSLESAVQANQEMLASMEQRADDAVIEAARLAEAEAAAMADVEFSDSTSALDGNAVEADSQEYVPPSYGRPDPPTTYDSQSQAPYEGQGVGAVGAAGAAGVAAGAAMAGGAPEVPFYQQDVSPNAHFSSQRSYAENAYGQNGAPGYQQPSYNQGQAQPQVWPPQTNTNKAFAMVLYVANLLGIIFALVVRDRDNEFITHHLNNCVVILIGVIIGLMLSAIVIGFLLLIYLFVMTIMGIVSAYNGDMKELPLIGKIHIVK